MTEAKHTPGPWMVAHIHPGKINVVPDRVHGFRALVMGGPTSQIVAHVFGKTEQEAEANARLIAASLEDEEAF